MATLILLVITLVSPLIPMSVVSAADSKNLIYDEANLLNEQEKSELNALANEYGAERQTDFVILTTNNTENQDVQLLTEDFYDEHALGYDKAHGNAVILTLDMYNRDVYLAGFYKAKVYLDSGRLDKIRNKITPDLTEGNYKLAFEKYINLSYKYMGYKPGVNPDNILFNIWFQLIASVAIGGIAVGVMAYRSGGRVTVNRATYEDSSTSSVIDRQDRYIRTTVTKRKIEKNNNNGGGGGGGGGTSRGGHSHSGSRGSF
ncbi:MULTISPECIES: YgcG family protein [unclassified Paenibacillus]|uniref:TPM domain-containing protein n=1 Tax=unclassified Paenibacillus TaxID=185978 RepID=UPI0015A5AE2E|nr:TPM domain-containing protein [Paenibacillus sp. E222]